MDCRFIENERANIITYSKHHLLHFVNTQQLTFGGNIARIMALDYLLTCDNLAYATQLTRFFGERVFENILQIYHELGPSIYIYIPITIIIVFAFYYSFTGKAHMTAVPHTLSSLGEIRDWTRTTMESTEEWRAMRVIVLGHGKIGKTTLIYSLQDRLVCNI
jgi:hypothetical protein